MPYGFNPYGGYGVPQAFAPQAYTQQMQSMGQAPMQQSAQQPPVNVRLVTSRDEATTAQIPFDATINVFINMAANEVYIKRFNPVDGGAIFCDYHDAQRYAKTAQKPAQEQQTPPVQYATVEMLTALERRVSELSDAMRGGAGDE